MLTLTLGIFAMNSSVVSTTEAHELPLTLKTIQQTFPRPVSRLECLNTASLDQSMLRFCLCREVLLRHINDRQESALKHCDIFKIMLVEWLSYASIMLYAKHLYYAQNYAGIICQA